MTRDADDAFTIDIPFMPDGSRSIRKKYRDTSVYDVFAVYRIITDTLTELGVVFAPSYLSKYYYFLDAHSAEFMVLRATANTKNFVVIRIYYFGIL